MKKDNRINNDLLKILHRKGKKTGLTQAAL
jgi:hypothetical protein